MGENHASLRQGIVNLPYCLGLAIHVDGEKLDLEHSTIRAYCRWLDLRTGTLYRRVTWETQSGKQVEIAWRRYMNPQDRFACVQDVHLTASQAVEVLVEAMWTTTCAPTSSTNSAVFQSALKVTCSIQR